MRRIFLAATGTCGDRAASSLPPRFVAATRLLSWIVSDFLSLFSILSLSSLSLSFVQTAVWDTIAGLRMIVSCLR